jgi:hypothetical protein
MKTNTGNSVGVLYYINMYVCMAYGVARTRKDM